MAVDCRNWILGLDCTLAHPDSTPTTSNSHPIEDTVLRFEHDDGPRRVMTTRRNCAASRREFLRINLLGSGLWGAGLGGWCSPRSDASEAAAPLAESRQVTPPGFGRAKSVILVYASGGQSQLETWDPKPHAPLDVRGEFSSIATSVPGVHFGEHMPRLAALADRYTVVRSMAHEDLDHGSACYLALTGRYHARRTSNPPPSPNDFPTYGAVLKQVRRTHRFPYDAVHVNGPALVPFTTAPGQNNGFLPRDVDPLVVGDVASQPVALPGLSAQAELPAVRLRSRQSLKETFDTYRRHLAADQRSRDLSGLYRQALDVLSSPHCRDAFDLTSESPALRDRYGRHRSGQACLLARRLVEAGTPMVTVMWNHSNRGQDRDPTDTDVYGWDTHNDIFYALREHLLPRFDASFATLIEDLDQRGLLDETLVICLGEFGRAPRVALEKNFAGSSPGRKHWSAVYSIVVAGAGVGRGHVVGASDRHAAEPVTKRFGPWDVAATMFSALGINPHGHFRDGLQRPFPITMGNPMTELYT